MINPEEKNNRKKKESPDDAIIKKWEERCSSVLIGKTITYVRYLNDIEQKKLGWFKKCVVIIFNDESYIFPSSDGEGNEAGALFTSTQGLERIPTI